MCVCRFEANVDTWGHPAPEGGRPKECRWGVSRARNGGWGASGLWAVCQSCALEILGIGWDTFISWVLAGPAGSSSGLGHFRWNVEVCLPLRLCPRTWCLNRVFAGSKITSPTQDAFYHISRDFVLSARMGRNVKMVTNVGSHLMCAITTRRVPGPRPISRRDQESVFAPRQGLYSLAPSSKKPVGMGPPAVKLLHL